MPISDLLAQITGEPSPTASTHTIPTLPKRKADDQLRKPVDKMQRTGPPLGGSSKLGPSNGNASAVDSSIAKLKAGQNGQTSSTQSPTATTFKNGQPTPPPSNEPQRPPKKGSYAEIMARAKAAQATSTQVGKIQHKRIEKLPSKREREELKATKAQRLQRNLGPNGKFRGTGPPELQDGRNGTRESHGKSSKGKVGRKASMEPVAEKKIKKAATATTGYAGTARPKPGAKAPSRLSMSASSRYDRGPNKYHDDRYGSSSKHNTYASEDEEDEEEEEDEAEGYGSDVSSDMEAAAFEVDDEEEEAARIARREDAEALAEENRHKREKEEKRKRLAAMAKARR